MKKYVVELTLADILETPKSNLFFFPFQYFFSKLTSLAKCNNSILIIYDLGKGVTVVSLHDTRGVMRFYRILIITAIINYK